MEQESVGFLTNLAVRRGCGRLECSILDCNQPAISFYEAIGAKVLPDWRNCPLSGDALTKLRTYQVKILSIWNFELTQEIKNHEHKQS